MKIPRCRAGFSLIEIVLAIGVMSFSMIAILGVVSVGLNSNRGSVDENLIATMARQVVVTLQQQRISENTSFANVTDVSDVTLPVIYFDSNGIRLQSAKNALFQCIVTARGNSDVLGPAPLSPVSLPCLLNLKLTFTWPLGSGKTDTSTIYTSLAKY